MKEEKNQPNIIDTRSRLRRTAYYSLATRAWKSGDSYTWVRALVCTGAQHVVSDTRRNRACEKFKAAIALVCVPLNHAPPRSHIARVSYTCAHDACLALMYRVLFPLSYFLPLYLSLFSFSVSLSDNAAKTADLGLLTMSVGRLIRYVGRRALRYSYLPGIRGLHRYLLALHV